MINFFENRHTAKIRSEPKFRVEIITDPDKLIGFEVQRVMFYLRNYNEYQQKGYGDILRFPDGIDPLKSSKINVDNVQSAIKTEFDRNRRLYDQFADSLSKVNEKLQTCVPVAERLYGFGVVGSYRVAPTAYGTVGSTYDPIYLRLPELKPPNLDNYFTTGKYPTPIEMLTHEILAHKITEKIRDGTAIDEFVERATHQWHKEYLMDLLGLTILTESSLMHANDVAMQVRAIRTAQRTIDPLYFNSDGSLSWAGDLQGLVSRIDASLKEEK